MERHSRISVYMMMRFFAHSKIRNEEFLFKTIISKRFYLYIQTILALSLYVLYELSPRQSSQDWRAQAKEVYVDIYEPGQVNIGTNSSNCILKHKAMNGVKDAGPSSLATAFIMRVAFTFLF